MWLFIYQIQDFGCDVDGRGESNTGFRVQGAMWFLIKLIFIDSCRLGRVGNDRWLDYGNKFVSNITLIFMSNQSWVFWVVLRRGTSCIGRWWSFLGISSCWFGFVFRFWIAGTAADESSDAAEWRDRYRAVFVNTFSAPRLTYEEDSFQFIPNSVINYSCRVRIATE